MVLWVTNSGVRPKSFMCASISRRTRGRRRPAFCCGARQHCAGDGTATHCLAGVDLHDLLLVTTLDEVVSGKVDVLGRGHSLEADLVLERLLELATVDDVLDGALHALDHDGRSVLHLLLLLLGERAVGLGKLLEVLAGLVALEHVLERREAEVVVDVVESCGSSAVVRRAQETDRAGRRSR